MSHVPLEDLVDKVDSKYRLVIIAGKRSRQLNQGGSPVVHPKSHKPTYVALEEMATGRVEYTARPLEEVAKAGVFAEAVKPAWFREIAPEEVVVEEEAGEEEPELEPVAPAETETEEEPETVAEAPEGELVDLEELEKADEEEEAG